MRATEQSRSPDARILDDPYAALFLGPPARAALRLGRGAGALLPTLTTYIVCRHRRIDDALAAALAAQAPRLEQVVVLGAGYDSRAWRFADALAGRPVFEVDFPATQARKLRLIDGRSLPAVDVRRVPIDFQVDRLDTVLASAGFRMGVPTFFIWEGVSMYLPRAAVVGTLTTLRALGGPGSQLAMDVWFHLADRGFAQAYHRAAAGFLSVIGEPVVFALQPEDTPRFCLEQGWEVEDLALPADLARRYVRDRRRVYPANAVLIARRAAAVDVPGGRG